MCGRFELSEPSRLLQRYPHLRFKSDFEPHYNIAPTQFVAGTCNDDSRAVVPLYWGFIPPWDASAARFSTINAKSETLAQKPLYRHAFASTRAVIYADGFFEWQRVSGAQRKQPMLIRMRDRQPFAMAGLWQLCQGPDGQHVRTATIATVPANSVLAPIHDRMPAILTDDALSLWLSSDVSPDDLQACLLPFDSAAMDAIPVRLLVNDVRNDSPAVIEPAAGLTEQTALF